MLRDRLLVRTAALAAIVTASSLSLVAAAGAETPAVAVVGQNAPQIEAGDALGGPGAASGAAVTFAVIPQLEWNDGSGRASYAFADAAGIPVAPPTEFEPLRLDALDAVSFLPAAEVATPAEPSSLSTVVLLAGLALLALGGTAMVSGSWHRRLRPVHAVSGGLATGS